MKLFNIKVKGFDENERCHYPECNLPGCNYPGEALIE
jgi:hypothetical protein